MSNPASAFDKFGGAPGRLPKCLADYLTSDEPLHPSEIIPRLQQEAKPVLLEAGIQRAVMSYVINIPADAVDIDTFVAEPIFAHYWRAQVKE